MKKHCLFIFLLTVSLLLSGCSVENTQGKTDKVAQQIEEWAASDSSIHSVTFLPHTEISKKTEASNSDTIVCHKMIDDIPLYEIYAKEAKLLPIMILLHEHEGSKEQFLDEAVLYAQAGFFCVLFDLCGYGERTTAESVESIEAAVFATQDIDLLLEYYRLSPYADSSHFVLYGHSMGGSAIWHYIAYGNKKPSAVIVCSAAADFTELEDMGAVQNGKSQLPAWDRDTYQNYCQKNNPVKHMDNFESIPMLVYQGMRDRIILPAFTQEFDRAVSKKNKDATFIYDETGAHDVTVTFLDRIIPFMKTYVKQNSI